MPFGIDSWYLVTAKSDRLIAALKDECIVAELMRTNAGEVVHAAAGACARARLLTEHRGFENPDQRTRRPTGDVVRSRVSTHA